MTVPPGNMSYSIATGASPNRVCYPVIETRPPGVTDNRFELGTHWVDREAGIAYVLVNYTTSDGILLANWASTGTAAGPLDSLTTDDAVTVLPTAGDIVITGDAAQGVSTTGANGPGTVTITVGDATETDNGVVELATDAESIAGSATDVVITPANQQAKLGVQTAHGVAMGNTGPTSELSWSAAGTVGHAFISGGAAADGAYGVLGVVGGGTGAATLTDHGVLIGSGTGAITPLAVASTGTLLAGATGADPAFTASPSVTGSLTAGTTVTATLGAITATDGNLVLGTAGNKIVIATGANASVGTSAAMVAGEIAVATTASSATAKIFYSRAALGTAMGNVSITAQDGTGFTLTSDEATETSTFNWWIINA